MRLLSSGKLRSISSSYRFVGGLGCALATALVVGCSDDASSAGSCTAYEDELGFSEDSSMAFSMADVLSGRRDQTSTLTWGAPKDWLPHSGEGETELVVRLRPKSDPAVEFRNEDTDCGRRLRVDVDADISTADGVLIATADGVVIARTEDVFEVQVELDGSDLEGSLSLSGEAGLAFEQTVDDDDVEGQLRAWRQESSGGAAQLRTGVLATWEGSVGAVPVDGNDDDPGTELDAGSEPTEDAGDSTPSEAGPSDAGSGSLDSGAMTGDAMTGDAAIGDAAITGDASTAVPEAGSATEAGSSAADSGSPDAG